MFSRIGKPVCKNFNKLNLLRIRHASWIKLDDGLYSVGIKNNSMINSLKINPNTIVNNDCELFKVKMDDGTEIIKAPFDCKIVERNSNLKIINLSKYDKSKAWIVKIEPIIPGSSLAAPLYAEIYEQIESFQNTEIPQVFLG